MVTSIKYMKPNSSSPMKIITALSRAQTVSHDHWLVQAHDQEHYQRRNFYLQHLVVFFVCFLYIQPISLIFALSLTAQYFNAFMTFYFTSTLSVTSFLLSSANAVKPDCGFVLDRAVVLSYCKY